LKLNRLLAHQPWNVSEGDIKVRRTGERKGGGEGRGAGEGKGRSEVKPGYW